MERYVWAMVVIFLGVLASATALILAGRSEELERFALLFAQGAGFIINFYLVFRSNRNTETRVRDTVQNGIQEAVQNGIGVATETGAHYARKDRPKE